MQLNILSWSFYAHFGQQEMHFFSIESFHSPIFPVAVISVPFTAKYKLYFLIRFFTQSADTNFISHIYNFKHLVSYKLWNLLYFWKKNYNGRCNSITQIRTEHLLINSLKPLKKIHEIFSLTITICKNVTFITCKSFEEFEQQETFICFLIM